jgi:pectinesterase
MTLSNSPSTITALTLAIVFAGCVSASSSPGGTGGSSSGSGGSGEAAGAGGSAGQTGKGGAGGAGVGGAGGTGAGGTGGTGAGGIGGTGAGGTGAGPCNLSTIPWTGSATRPQLTDASAACFTIKSFLAAAGAIGAPVTDNWDPTAGVGDASMFTPRFTVAVDGSGTHATVPEAIAAAKLAGGTARIYILVKPGIYRAPVCVDATVPITLYGADADATKVTIAYDNYQPKPTAGALANPCEVPSGATFGTRNSATFYVKANDFQAMNLTIANDTDEAARLAPAAASGTIQAVALTTVGDKLVFQNVHLLGNQDTLLTSSPTGAITRSYYKGSYIEGDTDFIFGRSVAVFDNCSITYVGTRKNNGGHFAPSTDQQTFGYLVINSRIAAGAGTVPGATSLARSYSELATSNGMLVIRETQIDNHINVVAPYKAATGTAIMPVPPFDATKSRLFEYKNTGTGAAP